VTTWGGFEVNNGADPYNVDALVGLGVPGDVAQALYDAVDLRQVSPAPEPDADDSLGQVCDVLFSDLEDGTTVADIRVTGGSCDDVAVLIVEVANAHEWGGSTEAVIDGYSCTFAEAPISDGDAGRAGNYRCAAGDVVITWYYGRAE
jgi:hypothetical protein